MENNECPICYESDKLLELVSDSCCHMFCITCLHKINDEDIIACPYCRTKISKTKAQNECRCCKTIVNSIKEYKGRNYCLYCLKHYLKNNCANLVYDDNYVWAQEKDRMIMILIKNLTHDELKTIGTDISYLNKYNIYFHKGEYHYCLWKNEKYVLNGVVKYLVNHSWFKVEMKDLLNVWNVLRRHDNEHLSLQLKYKFDFSKRILKQMKDLHNLKNK